MSRLQAAKGSQLSLPRSHPPTPATTFPVLWPYPPLPPAGLSPPLPLPGMKYCSLAGGEGGKQTYQVIGAAGPDPCPAEDTPGRHPTNAAGTLHERASPLPLIFMYRRSDLRALMFPGQLKLSLASTHRHCADLTGRVTVRVALGSWTKHPGAEADPNCPRPDTKWAACAEATSPSWI